MRAQRAAMIGGPGAAKLAIAKDEVRSKAVIDAEHVSKDYGDRHIIRDFTLRIQRGDRIGIVGPNGAGKTTLLKLLTGELVPDRGKVERAKSLSGIVIDQQRRLMEPSKRVLSQGSPLLAGADRGPGRVPFGRREVALAAREGVRT